MAALTLSLRAQKPTSFLPSSENCYQTRGDHWPPRLLSTSSLEKGVKGCGLEVHGSSVPVCRTCGEKNSLPSNLESKQKFQEARGWMMS